MVKSIHWKRGDFHWVLKQMTNTSTTFSPSVVMEHPETSDSMYGTKETGKSYLMMSCSLLPEKKQPTSSEVSFFTKKMTAKRHLIFYNCRWSTTDYFPNNFSCKCSLLPSLLWIWRRISRNKAVFVHSWWFKSGNYGHQVWAIYCTGANYYWALFNFSKYGKVFWNRSTCKAVFSKQQESRSCLCVFINSIYKHIEESALSPIQVLLNLRTAITDNLLYVDITASSEEDAYTIFEILNARGSALEGHELLKNFILRGIRPDGDVDTAKTTWSEIESLLGNNIERFVKHYATHKYRTSVQEGVSDYKLIRDSNKGIPTVPLLDDIYQKSIYYNRLLSPSQSEESANCSNVEFKVYAFSKSIGKNKFVLSF